MSELKKYPEKRELDGVFFRVERDGKWGNVCFSDMTDAERRHIRDMKAEQLDPPTLARWWYEMARILAEKLRQVGDEFDIVCDYGGDDD